MIDVQEIVRLQTQTVARWHKQPVDNTYEGFLSVVCQQHAFNFQLWHQEDIARCPEASDKAIADVKRTIDELNQKRNDWIEKIDDWIADSLVHAMTIAAESAPLNTETPGSAIDRLSIMSLRLYHLHEQLERDDVDQMHAVSVQDKVQRCLSQLADLSQSLEQLSDDIVSGRKRHRTYRQFKMYNDPTLNPYLYRLNQAVLKPAA